MSIEQAKICSECGEVVVPSMVLTGDEDFCMLAADACEAFDQHVCHAIDILDGEIDRVCDVLADEAEMEILRDILPSEPYEFSDNGELPF